MQLFSYQIILTFDESPYKYVKNYLGVYPYGEHGFNDSVEESNLIFDSLDKALKSAKKYIKENKLNAHLIIINQHILNQEKEDQSETLVVNMVNKKKYQFTDFFEFDHKKNLYKKGDWVYFYSNGYYQIGLIGAGAEGNEPYLILTENCSLGDSHPHEHIAEPWIFYSLEESEVKKILPEKYYYNITRRFKEHNQE